MIDKLLKIIDNSPFNLACIVESSGKFYEGISIDKTHALVNAVYSAIASGEKQIEVVYLMSKKDNYNINEELKSFIKKYLNEKTIFNLINDDEMKIYTYKEIIGEKNI